MKSIREAHSTVSLKNSPKYSFHKTQLIIEFYPMMKLKKTICMMVKQQSKGVVFSLIIVVVYSDETVRSIQGRVISASEFESDDFDTQQIQKDNNQDFVLKELEQVQLDTKDIIEELEELVVTVESEYEQLLDTLHLKILVLIKRRSFG